MDDLYPEEKFECKECKGGQTQEEMLRCCNCDKLVCDDCMNFERFAFCNHCWQSDEPAVEGSYLKTIAKILSSKV